MMKFLICLVGIVAVAWAQTTVTGPITQHFQDWLNKNGYQGDDFVRADLGTSGSYGGKQSDTDRIQKRPVVFFHGNSDAALAHNPGVMSIATGWTNSIEYFEQTAGYAERELYATTWGDANEMNAESRTHDCATLTRLRRFLEAVIKYTDAKKVDIISHSMGVTLARKLVQGGTPAGEIPSCDLGAPLNDKVETFVGISGGNYGLCNCQDGFEATCNQQNGYWPGSSCGFNFMCQMTTSACTQNITYSAYLMDLNENPLKLGNYVFSTWSYDDDLIMYHDLVWGNPTSLMPGSTAHKQYTLLTHMQTKELTAPDQLAMITNHTIPS